MKQGGHWPELGVCVPIIVFVGPRGKGSAKALPFRNLSPPNDARGPEVSRVAAEVNSA